jgi:hypothetical protein
MADQDAGSKDKDLRHRWVAEAVHAITLIKLTVQSSAHHVHTDVVIVDFLFQ